MSPTVVCIADVLADIDADIASAGTSRNGSLEIDDSGPSFAAHVPEDEACRSRPSLSPRSAAEQEDDDAVSKRRKAQSGFEEPQLRLHVVTLSQLSDDEDEEVEEVEAIAEDYDDCNVDDVLEVESKEDAEQGRKEDPDRATAIFAPSFSSDKRDNDSVGSIPVVYTPRSDHSISVVGFDGPRGPGDPHKPFGEIQDFPAGEDPAQKSTPRRRFKCVEIPAPHNLSGSPSTRFQSVERIHETVEDDIECGVRSSKRSRNELSVEGALKELITYSASSDESEYEPSLRNSHDGSDDETEWCQIKRHRFDKPVSRQDHARYPSVSDDELNFSINWLPDDIVYDIPPASNESTMSYTSSEDDDVLDNRAAVSRNGRRYWIFKTQPHRRIKRSVDVSLNLDQFKDGVWVKRWDGSGQQLPI